MEDPSRLGGGIQSLVLWVTLYWYSGSLVPSLISCLTCPDLSYSHIENLHDCKINLGQGRPGYEAIYNEVLEYGRFLSAC